MGLGSFGVVAFLRGKREGRKRKQAKISASAPRKGISLSAFPCLAKASAQHTMSCFLTSLATLTNAGIQQRQQRPASPRQQTRREDLPLPSPHCL